MAAVPTPTSSSPFTTRRPSRARSVDPCEATDPVDAANAAGLRYVTDRSPGIRRRKWGRNFRYLDPDGQPVRDPRDLARIKALAIPPAWTDVWISTRADGHLQATGRDAKGRKQYRYHPRWREVRDETKYGRMTEFGRALSGIRERVDEDLKRTGLPRERVLAAIVRLLERTLIRVGNEEYARTNDSYGLTTLRDDHVDLTPTAVHFIFRGKSGKEHEIDLHDRRLARIVRRCRDLPGQVLFQYLDDHGDVRSVGSADVNAYLREITGQDFTAKDFRTWFGTVRAARELLGCEPAESARERTHQIARAVETVSERLGNTPAICRRCYVHPAVIAAFEDGRLAALARELGAGSDEDDDRLVLRLLESEAGTS